MARLETLLRSLVPVARKVDMTDLAIVTGLVLLWQTYGPGLAGGLLLAIGLGPTLTGYLLALRRKP